MTIDSAVGYLGIFAGALALSWVLTPVALRIAVGRQVLDHPGGHKRHDTPVPYLGGLAIVAAFSVALVVGGALRGSRAGFEELVAIAVLALVLAVVGLVDDLRGLGVWVRLGAQTAAGLGAYAVGVRVSLFPVEAVDVLVTVVWLVAIANALNLLDNMDGLSAGTATVAAGGFFVIAAANGQFLVAALSVALAGCAIGFLRHNFHPARIYMGDAGSLFIGFLLGVIGIKLRFEAPREVTFLTPIFVLAVPLFDMALVVVNRLRHGRSPFRGGQDHTSHRLVRLGLPVPVAVGVVYVVGIGCAWLGLVLSRLDATTAYLLAGFVVAAGLLGGVLLSLVPVYDGQGGARYALVEVDDDGRPLDGR